MPNTSFGRDEADVQRGADGECAVMRCWPMGMRMVVMVMVVRHAGTIMPWRRVGCRVCCLGLPADASAVALRSRRKRVVRCPSHWRPGPLPGAIFEIRPLSPVLGAEVVGLDLAQPLDGPTRKAVYDAFVRYHVLCFRDQELTKDQQIAFTEQFGTLERHIARNRGSDNPLVHTVSNLDAAGKPSGKVGSQEWHTDKSFRPEPSLATILHAVVMPPSWWRHCFANMYAAYEALSEIGEGRGSMGFG